ncbi:hypothetical protein LTR17_014075 [Elasticomyces elasticus]|nr:hypothetical protein LTR17_014075 [Elasticomyces elasticus]
MGRLYYPTGLDTIEDVEGYRPGGYHPVHLGDTFDGRYKVLHKLGAGGFSTTWLARDSISKTYRALKILKAEETALSTELHILQRLAAIQSDQVGSTHIRHLIDHFTFQGPNGRHTCLITEVAGPSIKSLYNVPEHEYNAGARRLRADIAHKISMQIVQAVEFLHSHQMCHGDLTLSNVLLRIKSIDEWTEAEVYDRLGEPSTQELVTASGTTPDHSAPRYVVEPAQRLDAKYLTEGALLVDFGQAFSFDEPPRANEIGIPFMYCAPETIFESKFTPASEIWSLACALFEVRAGYPPFSSLMGGSDEIVMQMVQMKGRLPNRWWKAWDKSSVWFQENGKPLEKWANDRVMAVEVPIQEAIEEIGCYDQDAALFGTEVSLLEPKDMKVPSDEAESMRDLLEGMLKWEAEDRMSVTQVLQHRWISG